MPHERQSVLLNFGSLTIFVLLSTLITIIIIQYQQREGIADTYSGKQLTNGTFLENPTDKDLVTAFTNGKLLSSYINPKESDFTLSKGSWTVEKLAQMYPDTIEKINSEDSKKTYFIKDLLLLIGVHN